MDTHRAAERPWHRPENATQRTWRTPLTPGTMVANSRPAAEISVCTDHAQRLTVHD